MSNTKQSPEPKKVPHHPAWTPEEIQKLKEEQKEMIEEANKKFKEKGWQD